MRQRWEPIRWRAGGVRLATAVVVLGGLALIAAYLQAAPGAEPGLAAGPGRDPAAVALRQEPASPAADVASALEDPDAEELPAALIDTTRIRSGGPPPDGIPAIDEPRFLRAGDLDWLAEDEPVLSLSVGEATRAYPVQVLTWHEIVNDTVDGVPVLVSYCPLCNSALAYDRRVGDQVLDFGTSGKLLDSNLVMYDRQTESLWPQLSGQAVAGTMTGTQLKRYGVSTVAWADWREAHPDGWVLSRNTGFDRDYGRNPYIGYDTPTEQPFLFSGDTDPRLPPKARIVAIGDGPERVAVTHDRVRAERVVPVELGDREVVVLGVPGLASALDTSQIAEGRDVLATGVFEPVLDGRRVDLRPDGEGFVDAETGSRFDILGRGVAGPLDGEQLPRVTHDDTLWFAWAAFSPDTQVVG